MTELHPTRRTVVRTAAWAVPAVTLATATPAFAASSDFTDLSTSVAATPTRHNATQVNVPKTTFKNTGNIQSDGMIVVVTSTLPISKIEATGVPLFGNVSVESGTAGLESVTKSADRRVWTMVIPPTGLAAAKIPAGGTYTASYPQRFTFDAPGGAVTLQTTVTGRSNVAQSRHIPYSSNSTTIP